MFQIIAKLCIIIMLLATVSITLARILSSQSPLLSPNSVADGGFAACELPCWGGIMPGETPLDKVEQQLRNALSDDLQVTTQNFNSPSGQQNITNFSVEGESNNLYYGSISYSLDKRVRGLYVELDISLPYLLDALGAPTCLIPFQADTIEGFQIIWQRESIHVTSLLMPPPDAALISRNSIVTDLRIVANDITMPCSSPYSHQWRGFAPQWYYQTLNISFD